MDALLHWNWGALATEPEFQSNAVRTLVIVLVLVAVRWAVLRVVNRNVEDARTLYRWRKAITYTTARERREPHDALPL
jgi:hypothetical protein